MHTVKVLISIEIFAEKKSVFNFRLIYTQLEL